MQTRSLESKTIRLEGPLFVPDTFFAFLQGDFDKMQDFRAAIPEGTRLNDEIDRAWNIASDAWRKFSSRREARRQDAVPVFLGSLFRDAFGYSELPLSTPAAFRLPFPSLPVFCTLPPPRGSDLPPLTLDTPDRRFSGDGLPERRRSISQFAQQWLNLRDDALWAVASDGLTLRLFRDNASLTRPAYVEADLARIFAEGRRGDFAALFRLLYRDRPGTAGDGRDSVWEKLRTKSAEDGVRVFNDLRDGVVKALLFLGDGFLKDSSVRDAFASGALTPETFFHELLRTAYRFLFLFAAEERNALHDPAASPSATAVYAEGYSMRRLADRCRRASARTAHADLWEGVRIVFRSLAAGEPRLALPALGGIFREDQAPRLDAAALANRDLLDAIRALRWFERNGVLQRVNYHNLGAEELGSVYESLLELVPSVSLSDWRFSFVGIPDPRDNVTFEGGHRGNSTAGNARKTSGSYYTPASLVDQLVRTTIDPLLESRLSGLNTPAEREAALLSLSVLDPACGSGHFLLAAAHRIAKWLVQVRSEETPANHIVALRDVVSRCIYGTDLNPMAVELAKIALWLETLVPGQPLSFLDAHFAVGNSVIGISSFAMVFSGIPSTAFDALDGDDAALCKTLKQKNKSASASVREDQKYIGNLFTSVLVAASARALEIETMPEATITEIVAKRDAYHAFLSDSASGPAAIASNLFVAAFFMSKTTDTADICPTSAHLFGALGVVGFPQPSTAMLDAVADVCLKLRPLHWPFAFPSVFARGGFDLVIGNPPWDMVEVDDVEWFSARVPSIGSASKTERSKLIHEEKNSQSALAMMWKKELEAVHRFQNFLHESTRFPASSVGRLNLAWCFLESTLALQNKFGRVGMVVPSGLATDSFTKKLFRHLVDSRILASFYDFDNGKGIFPAVHKMFKFCLLTLAPSEAIDFSFFLQDVSELANPHRHFSLTEEEFELINPDTKTAPVFRTREDKYLTTKLYKNAGAFVVGGGKTENGNPWGARFMLMFMMDKKNPALERNRTEDSMPLYEGKMINQFDHRWASYPPDAPTDRDVDPDEVTFEQKTDTSFQPLPRRWIRRNRLLARLADVPPPLSKAVVENDIESACIALAQWVLQSFWKNDGESKSAIISSCLGDAFLAALPHDWATRALASRKVDYSSIAPLKIGELGDVDSPDFWCQLLETRSPQYLMCWRDVTNSANSRTSIASVLPLVATSDSLPIIQTPLHPPKLQACLLADLNSLTHDYVARQKVGGLHMRFFTMAQIATLPPSAYTPEDIDYIVPRVLELTYTTNSLRPWAKALDYDGAPFPWDDDRRALLRAELDARYARLYGLSRDDLRYILDPKSVMGPDFPSETFRVLQGYELRRFGEYRTQRMVLDAWDAQENPLDVADDYTRTQTWDDSRPSYLRFLVSQMIAQSSTHQIPLAELFSAFSALRTPLEMSRMNGMPKGAEKWARANNDAIREDESLEAVLMDMFDRGLISISKTGIVSYVDEGSLHAADNLPDVVADARMALAFMRLDLKQARIEHVRRIINPEFFRQVMEGAYARAA